jgi:hypothetical protein
MFSLPRILYNTPMRQQAPSTGPDSNPDLTISRPRSGASARVALIVSHDGYVRLTLSTFRAIALRHLFSGLDQDEDEAARASTAIGASKSSILGFTEWVSDTTPAVSLGWDWRVNTIGGGARYVRDSEVRSNVMLVEPGLGDLGDLATSATLSTAVDALAWQAETNHYISNQYGQHLSHLTVTPS